MHGFRLNVKYYWICEQSDRIVRHAIFYLENTVFYFNPEMSVYLMLRQY